MFFNVWVLCCVSGPCFARGLVEKSNEWKVIAHKDNIKQIESE